MKYKVGNTVIVKGTGSYYGVGIPMNCDGCEAVIKKVGNRVLTVLVKGENFSRKTYFYNVKPRRKKK